MEIETAVVVAPVKRERKPKHARGVFERRPGEWWICYWDAQGRRRREKAGTWAAARDLYTKRKNQVPRKRENNIRTRFLDAQEEAALRAKIRALHPAREPELDLALHTGMRRNEQWQLRWQDVNFRAGIITILQSKHGAARHVPINSVAERALETLAKNRNGSPYACAGSDEREGRDWERWFEECVRKAQIADFRWHDLRHTFASRLAMAGVSLRTLAELLGHKTLAMVMRYAHLAPAHLREAVERIAEGCTATTSATGALVASEASAARPN